MAIDSRGRAMVVWQRLDGSSYTVQAVRIAADGTPGSVTDLSKGGDARFPQVAIDSQDRRTVVWSRFDGSNWRVQRVRGAANAPTLSTTASPGVKLGGKVDDSRGRR